MLKQLTLPLFIVLALLINIHAASAAEEKTVVLDIPGMTCKFCPITIKKALNKVDGVMEVSASYDTKTATVRFDPDRTTTEALIKATTNAGYPSSVKK